MLGNLWYWQSVLEKSRPFGSTEHVVSLDGSLSPNFQLPICSVLEKIFLMGSGNFFVASLPPT